MSSIIVSVQRKEREYFVLRFEVEQCLRFQAEDLALMLRGLENEGMPVIIDMAPVRILHDDCRLVLWALGKRLTEKRLACIAVNVHSTLVSKFETNSQLIAVLSTIESAEAYLRG